MSERRNNSNITDKIAHYCTINEIKYSNQVINFINIRIKLYSTLLDHLEDSKPLFFQKRKTIEYNKKVKEYNAKLEDLYNELDEEIMLMGKIYD